MGNNEIARHVTVAGGGIAALEAVLALRSLLADAPIEIVAPVTAADYRPLAVLVPFALGELPAIDLARFAADQGASLRRDTLVEVKPAERVFGADAASSFPTTCCWLAPEPPR